MTYALPMPHAGTGGPSGPLRLLAIVFWFLLPALAGLGIVVGLITLANHGNDQPPGIPGVFTVEARSGFGNFSIPSGTFVSDDGVFTRADVTGVSGWSQGSRHRVVYDPSTQFQIVPLPGRWDPTATITALTGAVGLLFVWGWLVAGGRRSHGPVAAQPA